MMILHGAAGAAGLAVNLLSPSSLLSSYGALGLFVVLFAETGLLVGFFLPGDSLLFAAGLAASTKSGSTLHLPLAEVLLCAAAGALAGAEVGYLIGRGAGPALLQRSRNRHVRRGAERAAELLARYGQWKAVVLARFIPVVRTLANPVAGALGVPAATFTIWQVIGGLVWSLGITSAGYALGSTIPGVDQYLLPVIAVIVVLSLLPLFLEFYRSRRRRQGHGRGGGRHAGQPQASEDEEADPAVMPGRPSGPRHGPPHH
jgi:membrane-associated protein